MKHNTQAGAAAAGEAVPGGPGWLREDRHIAFVELIAEALVDAAIAMSTVRAPRLALWPAQSVHADEAACAGLGGSDADS